MDIDLLAAKSFENGQPHDQFEWLRANAPVYRHPEHDGGPGYWAVTRHEDVRAVSRNHAVFSNEPTISIADNVSAMDLGGAKMLLMSDPPHQTHLRRLVSQSFTPRAAQAMVPRLEALSRTIVDDVIEKGECDFVSDVAGELPSYVIAELMGLPLDDGRELYKLTEVLHSAPEALEEGQHARAGAEMFAYSVKLLAEKRANPKDDLATRLIQSEIEGRRLSDMEFHLFFLLLIDAGGDTTRNLVAGGIHALLEHPHQLGKLLSDVDGLVPGAREEMLRYISPVVYMRRTAKEDTEIAGQAIAAGDKVALYYGSANRDEAAFENPQAFDIERTPNHHVAFGATGAHFCLGAKLARFEIDALLREVLTRMSGLELVEQPEWLGSNFISGPRRMAVRFQPGPRTA